MRRKTFILISLGGLLLLACGIYWPVSMTPHGMGPVSYRNYISYTGGPAYGGMMGGRLACVSCHGEDGRGGLHWMHMQQMDAPDIRYSALINDHDEAGEEELLMDEYDLDAFRIAVVLGQHLDGDSLSYDMPRWKMSDSDLADLLDFLKTLSE